MGEPRQLPESLATLIAGVQYAPRSEGCHVSQIIKSICATLDPKRFGGPAGPPDDTTRLRWELGLVFEDVLGPSLASRYQSPHIIRPGEIKVDGIWGTADVINLDIPAVEEWKCTWMSCYQPITDPKFWHYWVQLKAYCKMYGVTVGRLRVLFINGDYRNSGPVFRCWEQEFDHRDLDENWQMLVSEARRQGWI